MNRASIGGIATKGEGPAATPRAPQSARLASLDMFRGLAIAGMVLVNNPGSWEYVYRPLRHAEWHGFTPADLVFPAFLLAVGAAIPFMLAGYAGQGSLSLRIARRVVLLFALGLVLNLATPGLQWLLHGNAVDWGTLRIMGVLQRIALAYLIAILLILALGPRGRVVAVLAILLGYWAALAWVPVPVFGPGDLRPDTSLVTHIDRLILTRPHMYKGRFDPEGLLSTVPAAATVMIGYLAGAWIRRSAAASRVTLTLALAGLAAIAIGWVWDLVLPINKALWTSSYVAYSAGWSLLLLAACYEVMEVRRWRRIGWPLVVLGVNAIALFFGSGIVARVLLASQAADGRSLYRWLYDNLFVPWAGPMNGSLAFSLATLGLWWLVLYALYRRGWFLRL
jgi:predicted acyltransferase